MELGGHSHGSHAHEGHTRAVSSSVTGHAHAESSSRARPAGPHPGSIVPQRSSSPPRSDPRDIRAVCSDVQRKIQEFYKLDLMPKTFTIKFRQRVEGLQLGANFEVNGCNTNDCNTKLVIKPASSNSYWKVICEPKQRDVRLLTKKIPVGPLLHLQFGIGHDFLRHSTGWKWKVTSAFGANGLPEVHRKTVLPVFPGFDINVDWNAQYELPELHGAMGTGEPAVEMNLGRLRGSIERVAAVYTHVG